MTEFTYTIKDKNGIHARPAGAMVKTADSYESEIELLCKGKNADAKRIFSVMSLGAAYGDTIKIIARGSDEEAAICAMKNFFENNL